MANPLVLFTDPWLVVLLALLIFTGRVLILAKRLKASARNPSLADLLAAAINQDSTIREPLKEYTRQLAVEREKEWAIANEEAQRCRVTLSGRPPAPAKKSSPPKP